MNRLIINDLEINQELTRKAMQELRGKGKYANTHTSLKNRSNFMDRKSKRWIDVLSIDFN